LKSGNIQRVGEGPRTQQGVGKRLSLSWGGGWGGKRASKNSEGSNALKRGGGTINGWGWVQKTKGKGPTIFKRGGVRTKGKGWKGGPCGARLVWISK